jgi:hypothetical protein
MTKEVAVKNGSRHCTGHAAQLDEACSQGHKSDVDVDSELVPLGTMIR